MVIEDCHNLGAFYYPTLMAWFRNFESGWIQIQQRYDERFRRMWRYYLLSLAGAFRARTTEVWQIVLSKNGLLGGYASIR
jgi:cyclopropane-fatty-acyl-phospholipid synthase